MQQREIKRTRYMESDRESENRMKKKKKDIGLLLEKSKNLTRNKLDN